MSEARFTFADQEKLQHVFPDVVWEKRRIRLLITDQRIVFLTKELLTHLLTVILLAILAGLLMLCALKGAFADDPLFPWITLAVFGIALFIHLQYRFCNPRLHRIIEEFPVKETKITLPENGIVKITCKNAEHQLTVTRRIWLKLQKIYGN